MLRTTGQFFGNEQRASGGGALDVIPRLRNDTLSGRRTFSRPVAPGRGTHGLRRLDGKICSSQGVLVLLVKTHTVSVALCFFA